jgi:Holliday junction resolvasome RuvABC endonuclease subunit
MTDRADNLRVIAIDPGTNSCGFSILELNLVTWDITVQESITIKANYVLKSRKTLADMIGEKDAKLSGYADILKSFLERWEPDCMVIENPYMGKFAATFGALKEQLMVFRLVAWQFDKRMSVSLIEPSPVKQNMGVSGKSGDKDLMTKALKSRSDVSYSDNVRLIDLDEHSIDSICIGLYEIDKIKRVFYGNVLG